MRESSLGFLWSAGYHGGSAERPWQAAVCPTNLTAVVEFLRALSNLHQHLQGRWEKRCLVAPSSLRGFWRKVFAE